MLLKATLEQSTKLQGLLNAKMQALDRARGEREFFLCVFPSTHFPLFVFTTLRAFSRISYCSSRGIAADPLPAILVF